MTSLSDTIARLAVGRAATGSTKPARDRLIDLPGFHPDPGALRARSHAPADLAPGAPLVVVLHGCTQNAAAYDHGAGWSTLADRHGFALLFPEQVQANNQNRCFNWFAPADIARRGGEAESIASMTAAMIARHGLDRRRVFVTGLSAGGAMAAVMLATYPELFAGGAIIGGLPYECASSIPEAFANMRGQGGADEARLLGAIERAGSGRRGSWPTVSLWHGIADATVSIANLDRSGRQWRHAHGLEGSAPAITTGPGWERRAWGSEDGRAVVEEWRIAGMGHGVPIDPNGPSRLGASGPYMLDVGLSSTAEIARGWGLIAARDSLAERVPDPRPPTTSPTIPPPVIRPSRVDHEPPTNAASNHIQDTIEAALRSAGLMR